MQSATVAYMTGTGNTWRAASRIAETLKANGWAVELHELRRLDRSMRGDFAGDLLVLCFPVLAFGMPVMVRTVLRALRGRGRDAAVFATWGGAATAALWQARGFLRRRGFRVVATDGAAYPFNWTQMLAPTDAETSRSMTRVGDDAARQFAVSLSGSREGALVRKTSPASVLVGLPVSWLYATIGRFALGAIFAADERCTACGACARGCPASAITLAGPPGAQRPRWLVRCQGCNRCVNTCPAAAIQSSPFRAIVHGTLSVVIMVVIAVGLNRLSALAGLPAYLSVPAWIVAFVLLAVYLSRLQFAALEPLLFALERAPGLRRWIGKSWTARFGRNRAEGFTPRQSGTGRRTRRTRRS